MSNTGTLAARLTLTTTGAAASMADLRAVSEKELARIQRQVKVANDYLRDLSKGAKEAATSSAGMTQAAKHMEEFGFHTAGAKRELLVLAHELSQGNWKQFGGSMLVLGERTGAASLLFSGMGLAALAAAASVGTFVAAAVKGANETEELRKALQLTGNASGITGASFDHLSASAARATGSTVSAARDALQALVGTGRIGQQNIGTAQVAMLQMEKLTGASSDEIAKDFAKMADGVAKWAAEHNKYMHFVTAGQFAYIKQLEEQGKAEQAAGETFTAIANHSASLAKNLGTLERAWKSVTDAADGAWQSMLSVGREDSTAQKISKLTEQLNRARTGLPGDRYYDADGKQVAGKSAAVNSLQERLSAMVEQQKLERQQASAMASNAAANQRAIDKMMQKPGTGPEAPALGAIRDAKQQYKADFLRTEIASYKELAEAEARAAEGEARRLERGQKTYETLLGEIQKYNLQTDVIEGNQRAIAEWDNWAIEQRRRLTEQTRLLTAAELEGAEAAIAAAAARRKVVEDKLKTPEAKIGKWITDGADQAKQAERMWTGSLTRMEDAVVNFAKTGKLSFSDLFSFMAEEFIRNQIKMAEKRYLTNSAGDFIGGDLLGKLGGGIGSVIGSIFSGLPTFAQGTNNIPYDGMPAILHKGEAVVPAAYNPAVGGHGSAARFDFSGQTFHIGQGVSRAEVFQAVQMGNQAVEGRMRRLMRQGALS